MHGRAANRLLSSETLSDGSGQRAGDRGTSQQTAVWGNLHRGFESLPLRQPPASCARSSVDRALGCGPKGRGFESRRARQTPRRCGASPAGSRHDRSKLDEIPRRRPTTDDALESAGAQPIVGGANPTELDVDGTASRTNDQPGLDRERSIVAPRRGLAIHLHDLWPPVPRLVDGSNPDTSQRSRIRATAGLWPGSREKPVHERPSGTGRRARPA